MAANLNDLSHEDFLKVVDRYYQHPPICASDRRVEWLEARGSDPDFWHCTALGWNWDAGVAELHWIAKQPTCEQATASWILIAGCGGTLWRSRDECRHGNDKVFDMFSDIAERWRSGFYRSNRLGFDGHFVQSFAEGVKLYKKARARIDNPSVWSLPSAAFGPFAGRPATRPTDAVFEDGVLRLTMQRWYELYG
jgi:hypothetical protein